MFRLWHPDIEGSHKSSESFQPNHEPRSGTTLSLTKLSHHAFVRPGLIQNLRGLAGRPLSRLTAVVFDTAITTDYTESPPCIVSLLIYVGAATCNCKYAIRLETSPRNNETRKAVVDAILIGFKDANFAREGLDLKCDVIVFENLRFARPHEHDKSPFAGR